MPGSQLQIAARPTARGADHAGTADPAGAGAAGSAVPNTLPRPRRRSMAAELVAQLANMFAVVRMVAAGLAFRSSQSASG